MSIAEQLEYLQRAQECERLARQVVSDEQRHKMLQIAAGWRALAAGGHQRH